MKISILLCSIYRFAVKKKGSQKEVDNLDKDEITSPRRKKVKSGDDKFMTHEMLSEADFKKQCEAGKLHYGKKNQNRKHLETILVVCIL